MTAPCLIQCNIFYKKVQMVRSGIFLSNNLVFFSFHCPLSRTPAVSAVRTSSFLSSKRLAAASFFPPMLTTTFRSFTTFSGKKNAESSAILPFPWDTSLRLQGVVTAFKHRRGYGFVLVEGYTRRSENIRDEKEKLNSKNEESLPSGLQEEGQADSSHRSIVLPKSRDFFFTRVSLGGGYFVNEGDRVSFRVKTYEKKGREDVKTPRHSYLSRGESLGALGNKTESEEIDGGDSLSHRGGPSFTAVGLRHYNAETGKESRVLPVTITGVITQWNPSTGTGIISELDVDGVLHADDAPKFEVTLENTDLSPVPESVDSFVAEGRYVKFCASLTSSDECSPDSDSSSSNTTQNLENPSNASVNALPKAYRVIIDVGAEKRHGVIPKSPDGKTGLSYKRPKSSPSAEIIANQRGVIREIVERKYAFVVDDASGESIFFHFSEMEQPVSPENLPQIGDSVIYDTKLLASGRHAGKKHCTRVRLLSEENVLSSLEVGPNKQNSSVSASSKDASIDTSVALRRGTKNKNPQRNSEQPKSLLEEFDLLD